MRLEKEFKAKVFEHLDLLTKDIFPVLKALIEHTYPMEVKTLSFEVFADCFTTEFPIRVFFMDECNSEHFIWEGDNAKYPSPVDPDLLEIDCVYPYELEEKYLSQDETLELWDIATEALISWFSNCWKKVGGGDFPLNATIASHDSHREYDLKKLDIGVPH